MPPEPPVQIRINRNLIDQPPDEPESTEAPGTNPMERVAATLELAARGGIEASMRLLQIAEGMRALASAEGATPAASSRSEGASR